MRRGSIIAGLSLISVGCSAITSFDGLIGESESSDAGTQADATTSTDGSTKPTADGSIPSDTDGSSFDAGKIMDSPVSQDGTVFGYCPNHTGHTFCDDFDPTSSLAGRWTTQTGIGTVAAGTFDYNSPPRSVVAMSPDTDGGQDGEDDIQKSFATGKTMDIEAAIKVATLNAQSVDFIAIEFVPTDQTVYKTCYFDVAALMGNGTLLEVECQQPDGGDYYQSQALTGSQPNWDRVHLGVNMMNNQVTAIMSGTTKKLFFPAGLSTTKFTVMAGVVYKDIGSNAVVRVDDVIIDTQ